MSDLIMPLIDEKDPFLREVPHRFDFDSPPEDPDKLEKRLIDNMYHYNGIGLLDFPSRADDFVYLAIFVGCTPL